MADLTKARIRQPQRTDVVVPTYAGRVIAVKNYAIGAAAVELLRAGSPARTLATMSGLSEDELLMAVEVAKRYTNERAFLAAYDLHRPLEDANNRSWHTFLEAEGLAMYSRESAATTEDSVKAAVRDFVRTMRLDPDRGRGADTIRKMRMWVLSRLDAPSGAIDDEDWFRYAPCTYCGANEGPCEIVESDDFILSMCQTCRDEGVDPESPDWQRVADAYKQFASECMHAITKLYGRQ